MITCVNKCIYWDGEKNVKKWYVYQTVEVDDGIPIRNCAWWATGSLYAGKRADGSTERLQDPTGEVRDICATKDRWSRNQVSAARRHPRKVTAARFGWPHHVVAKSDEALLWRRVEDTFPRHLRKIDFENGSSTSMAILSLVILPLSPQLYLTANVSTSHFHFPDHWIIFANKTF